MVNAWEIFDKIEQAKATVVAEYFQPGRYIAKIDAVRLDIDRAKIPIFIVQTTILHILSTECDVDGNPCIPNAVGTNPSTVYKQGGPGADSFMGNCKAFAAVAGGISPSNVTTRDIAFLCNEKEGTVAEINGEKVQVPVQPATGLVIEVHCRQVRKVKKPEETINLVNWVRLLPFSQVLAVVDEAVLAKHYDLEALRSAAEVEST